MKPLQSVDLRHRITIVRPVKQDNGKGGFITTWETIATPFAEVIGLDGRESVMAQVLQGISVYRFRIWYRIGISPADQIKLGSRDLNVRSVADPFGDRRELMMIADTASARPAK